MLARDYPVWSAPIRYGDIELPLAVADVLAMQSPISVEPSRPLWRLRPPPDILPGRSLAVEGIVSLWPWPGLLPDDIRPLMALRERLGFDPLPPMTQLSDAHE